MCWSTGSWLGLLLGHSHTQICPSAPELEIRAGDDEDEDDDDDEDDEYGGDTSLSSVICFWCVVASL